MKDFSKNWKGSRNPRKQRKYRIKAQLHLRHKFVHAHLSKELRKRYNIRSVALRKGDKVKVLRGSFMKHEGKVEIVALNKTRAFVSGVELTKKDGTKKLLPLHPSNLLVTELNMDDKMRQKNLERK